MNGGSLTSRWRSWAPELLGLLRIIVAFLFIQIGTAKIFALPAPVMPGGVTAPFTSLAGVAGLLETFGGFLILIGLCTRPVAFILSGEMAVAYFYGHARLGFWPVLNGGGPAIYYCFFFLYLSAAGAGAWSVDTARAQRDQRR